MGYERSTGRYYRDDGDRRYGARDRDEYRDRDPRDYRDRDYRARSGGYDRPRDYDDDRGFFDRAGDEVRSWFGDEEAERRRRWDERLRDREDDRRYRDADVYDSGRYTGSYPGDARGPSAGSGFYNPSGADYGAGRGAGATSTWGLGGGSSHDGWGLDPNYRAWRRRQLAELDRDYEDYRRENESRFHNDFGSWRSNRQSQRQSLGHVQEHQEVVGSDGTHIGKVDHIRGDRILLTKSDEDAGGRHHSVPCAWIAEVGDKVKLNRTAAQAQAAWKDEEKGEGPHYLNRAFPGTY
ncbi:MULTISPECIES: DUF2171 domain-containing protein [unclassified Sphingomonas]|uniref:DUF2171 domain-containing protein n=1 Tax=unclassified Sphingomonas TaxID=196159 RepID=UPI0006F5AEEC|nr:MULTISPECIES: DUF2171 domain-containing protein [unclassified Sphingomonas]KQX20750.1 hypothetical protein ASD17_07595 [Sphingomonas sp. Root1294]KQY68596.1 hypothetical protein ASD39_04115 [Sphingomonas sp. Root50]KRB88002.1 hypothetical protein ASE22_21290 [Sphingomonas sp. Root720]